MMLSRAWLAGLVLLSTALWTVGCRSNDMSPHIGRSMETRYAGEEPQYDGFGRLVINEPAADTQGIDGYGEGAEGGDDEEELDEDGEPVTTWRFRRSGPGAGPSGPSEPPMLPPAAAVEAPPPPATDAATAIEAGE